uniref:Apple domain-containing protein n=1 Tax=Chromera velia CCMP2878 TaxID=1169474 RepID=A0A0G4FQB4_9ALVE|eukprot:Cvel_3628.t1-p1 / transcript=Cvel_3628.t1 / gene=Cvel_3628 / organism=Chromera_velia_CCMP2878 / gene_product=SCO-spondin, putative / transcript_product=SCO-spondin, putative / location=Cvel_scaffold149:15342-35992(-) / protein_length=3330 / sequence_SO=supercontig / SO=protein_coding / is_pseudo=false
MRFVFALCIFQFTGSWAIPSSASSLARVSPKGFEGCPAASETETGAWALDPGQEETTVLEAGSQESTDRVNLQGGRSTIPIEIFKSSAAPQVISCNVDSLECAGCAQLDSNGKCTKCRPDWSRTCTAGNPPACRCTSCEDLPYLDAGGKVCAEICTYGGAPVSDTKKQEIIKQSREGISALDACCGCGGGTHMATPFAYDQIDFLLGDTVSLKPRPRTASRYVPSDDCGLEKYGLSLDSQTGKISGRITSNEAFAVSCQVTAVESEELGLVFNATVHVRASKFHYREPTLMMKPGVTLSPVVVGSLSAQGRAFQITCNPKIDWLDLASFSSDGVLKMKSGGNKPLAGGLGAHEVDSGSEANRGGANNTDAGLPLMMQPASICSISGSFNKKASSLVETETEANPRPDEKSKESISVLAMAWSMWSSLKYPSTQGKGLLLTVGQAVSKGPHSPKPGVKPKPGFSEPLAPAFFSIACSLKGQSGDVVVHEVSTGDVVFVGPQADERVVLFNMNPLNGQISGATEIPPPSANFPWTFDAKRQRSVVLLSCQVTAKQLPPTGSSQAVYVRQNLPAVVQDSQCWQPLRMFRRDLIAYQLPNHQTAEQCRAACAAEKKCSMFVFGDEGGGHKCWRLRRRGPGARSGSSTRTVDVQAKLRSCAPRTTCLDVQLRTEWMSGTFCPIMEDAEFPESQVYEKGGFTPEDSAYLLRFKAGRHKGPARGLSCGGDRPWMIVQGAAAKDFIDQKRGLISLSGGLLACLPEFEFHRTFGSGHSSVTAKVTAHDGSGNAGDDNSWTVVHAPKRCKSPLEAAGVEIEAEAEEEKEGAGDKEEERDDKGAGEVWRFSDPDAFNLDDPFNPSHDLDPCECFPPEWGKEPPVLDTQFEKLPENGKNEIPDGSAPPQLIARGQVSCVLSFLISSHPGSDKFKCAAKCRTNEQCHYFWVGMLGGAPQCRLYSECGGLMTELSEGDAVTEGELFGIARRSVCLVANPTDCMVKTKRRKMLTSVETLPGCPAGYRQKWGGLHDENRRTLAAEDIVACGKHCNQESNCKAFAFSGTAAAASRCKLYWNGRVRTSDGWRYDDFVMCVKNDWRQVGKHITLLEEEDETEEEAREEESGESTRLSPVSPHFHSHSLVERETEGSNATAEFVSEEGEATAETVSWEGRYREGVGGHEEFPYENHTQTFFEKGTHTTDEKDEQDSELSPPHARIPFLDERAGKDTKVTITMNTMKKGIHMPDHLNQRIEVVQRQNQVGQVLLSRELLWPELAKCKGDAGVGPRFVLHSARHWNQLISNQWFASTSNSCLAPNSRFQCSSCSNVHLTYRLTHHWLSRWKSEGQFTLRGDDNGNVVDERAEHGKNIWGSLWCNNNQCSPGWWFFIWKIDGAAIAISRDGHGFLRMTDDQSRIAAARTLSPQGADRYFVHQNLNGDRPQGICLFNKRYNGYIAVNGNSQIYRRSSCDGEARFVLSLVDEGRIALWNVNHRRFLRYNEHTHRGDMSSQHNQRTLPAGWGWERLRLHYVDFPTDGAFSNWSSWSACSATCGTGSQVRTRRCVGQSNGGKDCAELPGVDTSKDLYTETRTCQQKECEVGSECLFEKILMDCEQKQLVSGGTVIEECGKCEYLPSKFLRKNLSPLGREFEWGSELAVSCQRDRFSLLDLKKSSKEDQREQDFAITCADGEWLDYYGDPAFSNHECAACVQVGLKEMNSLEEQGKSAHYFASRMPNQMVVQLSRFDPHRIFFKKENSGTRLQGGVLERQPASVPSSKLWLLDAAAADERYLVKAADKPVASFAGNGCCRWDGMRWQGYGQQTQEGCKELCMTDQTCEAYEISEAGNSKFHCYLFYNPIQNFRLGCDRTSGRQKCFKKSAKCLEATTSAMEFAGYGCPRGSGYTHRKTGDMTRERCLQTCVSDQKCEAAEWTDLKRSDGRGGCYHFYKIMNKDFNISCTGRGRDLQAYIKVSVCNGPDGCPNNIFASNADTMIEHAPKECNAADKNLNWDVEFLLSTLGEKTAEFAKSSAKKLAASAFYKSGGGMNADGFTKDLGVMPFATDGAVMKGVTFRMTGSSPRRLDITPRSYTYMSGLNTAASRSYAAKLTKDTVTATIGCPVGSVMQDLTFSTATKVQHNNGWASLVLTVQCTPAGFSPECTEHMASFDASNIDANSPMDAIVNIQKRGTEDGFLECGGNFALQGLTMKVMKDSGVVSGEYVCCSTGRPSVAIQALPWVYNKQTAPKPSDLGLFAEFEGVYCPARKDSMTGRLVFDQEYSFRNADRRTSPNRKLRFDPHDGIWRISDRSFRVIASQTATPQEDMVTDLPGDIGLVASRTSKWESTMAVVPYSDFEWETKHEPEEKIERPKKPSKPPPPELKELSKADMEKQYLPSCRAVKPSSNVPLLKDLDDLDPKKGPAATGLGKLATSGDEEGELPFGEPYDGPENPSSAIMKNPCGYQLYVKRKETSKIDNDAFMGQQTLGPDASGMNFQSLVDCFNRESVRNRVFLNMVDRMNSHMNYLNMIVRPALDLGLCGKLSITQQIAAPMGIGLAFEDWTYCEYAVRMIYAGLDFYNSMAQLNMRQFLSNADISDCNPNRDAFSKVFCDLMCISDAVRAGNKAILDRLSEVFTVLQGNLLKMMAYHSDYTNELLQWLADLQDYHAAGLKDAIKNLPSGTNSGSLFLHRLKECRGKQQAAAEEDDNRSLAACVMNVDLKSHAHALLRSVSPHLQPGDVNGQRSRMEQKLERLTEPQLLALTRQVSAVAKSLEQTVRGGLQKSVATLAESSDRLHASAAAGIAKEGKDQTQFLEKRTGSHQAAIEELSLSAAQVETHLQQLHATLGSRLKNAQEAFKALLDPQTQLQSDSSTQDHVDSPEHLPTHSDPLDRDTLALNVRQSHFELMHLVAKSQESHRGWLDTWEEILSAHSDVLSPLVAAVGRTEFKAAAALPSAASAANLQLSSAVAAQVANLNPPFVRMREDALLYVSAARAMHKAESQALEAVEDYLRCHAGGEGRGDEGLDPHRQRREESDEYAMHVLPHWERMQNARVKMLGALSRSFRSSIEALEVLLQRHDEKLPFLLALSEVKVWKRKDLREKEVTSLCQQTEKEAIAASFLSRQLASGSVSHLLGVGAFVRSFLHFVLSRLQRENVGDDLSVVLLQTGGGNEKKQNESSQTGGEGEEIERSVSASESESDDSFFSPSPQSTKKLSTPQSALDLVSELPDSLRLQEVERSLSSLKDREATWLKLLLAERRDRDGKEAENNNINISLREEGKGASGEDAAALQILRSFQKGGGGRAKDASRSLSAETGRSGTASEEEGETGTDAESFQSLLVAATEFADSVCGPPQ